MTTTSKFNGEDIVTDKRELENILSDAVIREAEEQALEFTEKQNRYWIYANKKYNMKAGAAGVGKTFMDKFMIARRLLYEVEGKAGNKNVIIGTTLTTVKRNVIDPMRETFGPAISQVSNDGFCLMFGKIVHVFGAEKVSAKTKIQGTNIEYAYGDEVATWNEEFFSMFISRLRLENSKFDGTCNPEYPEHWLKRFIDQSVDNGEMFHQHYTIDDGILSEAVKDSQKKSLRGVAYDRLVLGLWAAAEGLIYEKFTEDPGVYLVDSKAIPPLRQLTIGVDFGQSKSKHAFVAVGISQDYDVYILETELVSGGTEELAAAKYVSFLQRVESRHKIKANYTYGDSARTTGIYALEVALERAGLSRVVLGSKKLRITDRINGTNNLIELGRLKYTELALDAKDSFMNATWDPKKKEDTRLDENTDILDAFEYALEGDLQFLLSVL